jgi:uncharacterized protein (TIGR03437 family)
VDVNPITNRVYVGGNINSVLQRMVWIDGNTNQIVKLLGPGQGEHVNPITNKIYAADLYGGDILVYSGADGSLLKTIPAFGCPIEAVVDSSLNHIWGGGQCGVGNDPAFLIDGSTDTLISGYLGSGGVMADCMAVNPVTHAFYVLSGTEKKVNPSTFAVTNAPFSAVLVAVNPQASRMYGADSSGKNVLVVDAATESLVATLAVSQTGAIAVNPTRNRVYAVDLSVSPQTIEVFDGGTNTPIGIIPLRPGDQACCGMAVNSSTGKIYLPVSNLSSQFLLVIDDTLGAAPLPSITTSSLPGGTVGVAYSQTLSASGGTPPYSNWTVSTGSLPPGLVLNAASGLISGTPSSATGSPFNFSVTVKDSVGNTSAAAQFQLTIGLASSGQTWTQFAPAGGPPPARAAHSAVLDAATNQMLVFGGGGGTSVLNDLWSLATPGSAQWTPVIAAGGTPPGRAGHSAVYDAANSRMTIFGGELGLGSPCANDVWVLSNANRVNGTPTWTQLNPSGTPPAPRVFHTAVYDPASNRMIVFGGDNCATAGTPFSNDVWVLSNANGLGGTPAWTQLSPAGAPPARDDVSAVYDAGSNRMIVFGGFLATPGPPLLTNDAGSNRMMVSGGAVFASSYNDVWILSNANGLGGPPTWTQLSPAGTPISARWGHTAVYDPSSNRMTVFSGGNSADIWVLSNANGLSGTAAWTQLSPTGTPPAGRQEHTAVYDAGSNRMIVFGGVSAAFSCPPLIFGPAVPSYSCTLLNDTWVLTNANGIASGTLPAVTTASLPSGTVGVAYLQTLSASGGIPPYSNWTVSAGSLPPGLSLNASSGVIGGTPSSATGSPFSFSVTVRDSVGNTSAPQALSITINVPTPTISSLSPNSAIAGGPAFTLTVNGTNFLSGAVVQWNGAALVTTFVSPTQLTAGVPAALIASVGTASVTVVNPGGAMSAAAIFTIKPYSVLDSASGRTIIAPNSFASIYGSGFTSWKGDWTGAIQNGVLPTTLGGVQVRINGKNCFINYVQSDQLNILTPFDTASGSVSVEVITAEGTAAATAVMAPVAPALFGYTLAGRFYAVAQIANTTIIVAPIGTFGSAPSRPAQAGDYLTLWALGMGSTDPAAPAGRVLGTAYPVSDLSSVKVRFGSVDAPVSWAGLVMAGLFQVNVLVPPGLSGDQQVVMTVDGHSTQANAFLSFQ